MRFRAMFGTVGAVLFLFTFTFLPPFFVGIAYNENLVVLYKSFMIPFFVSFLCSFLLWFWGRDYIETIREREAVVAVGIIWLLMAFFGALPYLFNGILTNFADAYFESMSGFATCGATVIDPPAIQQAVPPIPVVDGVPTPDYLNYPNAHSIFLWRSLTQWVGGMGIIVFSVVIIAKLLGGTVQLFKAETAGETVTRIKPKIQQTASILLRIYILFTLVETVLLWAAGVNLYDAVNYSFTTLATGGFGTHTASVAYWHSVVVEAIVITFMIIGSTSFVLHYKILTGRWRAILGDPEVRVFLLSLLFFTLLIASTLAIQGVKTTETAATFDQDIGFGEALRRSAFQVTSIHATAGFATDDYNLWPESSQLILVMLMLLGGCVGSTAGAIKISRVIILAKMAKREIQKVLHPRAVIPIRLGDHVISEEIAKKVGVFFFAYLLVFFISSLVMTFFGLDIPSAISAVATTMGGVGPGIGMVGPAKTFSFISGAGKIYLSLCMWVGRLEIFSAIILFFPSTYKE
ncbi:MAG: TrkH family potassium uptake protein [Thermoplasmata archaeon]|nr:TrkH family potassium uptake protein [Thermoplasmata archaeon]